MQLTRQRGISLLELLVSITIGLILLLVLFNLMTNLLVTQASDKRKAQVASVLDASMSMMSMELRRAGYWGSTSGGTNPYGTLFIENGGQCIRFSYAQLPDEAATAAANRYLAFRLNGSTLQRLQTTQANWSCTAAANLWQDMSKPSLAVITGLRFDSVNSGEGISLMLSAREPSGPSPQTLSRSSTVQLRNQPTVTTTP